MHFSELFSAFVFLWAVIDPIGTVPVFIASTQKHPEKDKKKIAVQAVIIAASVLLFFLIAGQFLLEEMGIPLSAFQVAGGIVLFLFSLTMILGESKPESEIDIVKSGRDTAIFPLAIPSIAGPGAIMAIVLLTDNHRFNIIYQVYMALIMLVVLVFTLLLLLIASYIQKLIGDSGASVVSRVMGLIMGAVAINSILVGIKVFYAL